MEQPVQLTPPANALVSTTVSELYPLVLAQMREFAIVLLDTEGVITWFSPSAEELFGHKLEHVAGKRRTCSSLPKISYAASSSTKWRRPRPKAQWKTTGG